MGEEMPATDITLGDAKQWLTDNFVKHTIKKVSALYFGMAMYDVQVVEEVQEINSIRKRQFRLYSETPEDTSKAWWESTMGPMSPPETTPVLTFTDEARKFLRDEVKANNIKLGELIYGDDEMERATATVIDTTSKEKYVIIKRSDNKFSMEDYTPVVSAREAARL